LEYNSAHLYCILIPGRTLIFSEPWPLRNSLPSVQSTDSAASASLIRSIVKSGPCATDFPIAPYAWSFSCRNLFLLIGLVTSFLIQTIQKQSRLSACLHSVASLRSLTRMMDSLLFQVRAQFADLAYLGFRCDRCENRMIFPVRVCPRR